MFCVSDVRYVRCVSDGPKPSKQNIWPYRLSQQDSRCRSGQRYYLKKSPRLGEVNRRTTRLITIHSYHVQCEIDQLPCKDLVESRCIRVSSTLYNSSWRQMQHARLAKTSNNLVNPYFATTSLIMLCTIAFNINDRSRSNLVDRSHTC
jgi:hypothetical protein